MELKKYRVVKEKYNETTKYYPEYKCILFPFVWFKWQDDKIVYEEYINFPSLLDCFAYINHKRFPARSIPLKKEIEIYKIDL